MLEDGRIRASGRHHELLRSDQLYQDLVAALHIAAEETDAEPAPNERSTSPTVRPAPA